MARIGEFEAAARQADPDRELDTFLFYGEEFTVASEPNLVALGRFMKAANGGMDTDDSEALPLLIDTVASCVVEADELRFLNLASKKRAQPELLLEIIGKVMETQSGYPTEQPAASSAGQSTTGESSKVPLSSAVPSGSNWRDTPFGRRELAANPEKYAEITDMEGAARNLTLLSG